MVSLCATQQKILNLGLQGIGRAPNDCDSVLFYGTRGSGKRTIVRALADALGFQFMEVPLRGPINALRLRLFGSETDSVRAREENSRPGDLGCPSRHLVYLSDLQLLPEELHHDLQRLITRGVYRDACNAEWRLASDVVIVLGRTDGSEEAVVTAQHWLSRQFRSEVPVSAPRESAEILELVGAMFRDIDPTARAKVTERDACDLLRIADGDLRTLRSWIQTAVLRSRPDASLESGDIWTAMNDDLQRLLTRIEYCSATVSFSQYQSWAAQFPDGLRHIPTHIVKNIAQRYYISRQAFQRGIQELIRVAGIPLNARVVFCKWQSLGHSAPVVAHELKNRGQWTVAGEIDLPRDEMPTVFGDGDGIHFVFADDFVGSGRTLSGLYEDKSNVLKKLIASYPSGHVRILIVAGYKEAIEAARPALRNISERISIHVSKLFGNRDRCFTDDSSIFQSQTDRELVEQFCSAVAEKHFPNMAKKHPCGFGNIGSLCVLYNNVPNNTLPIIWYDKTGCGWKPLFPARGIDLLENTES